MWFGDGAASVLLGEGDVIAEFLGSESLSLDFVDHYRGAQSRFDYTWEERWVRDEGYAKIIPEVVGRLFKKLCRELAARREGKRETDGRSDNG